MVYCKVTIFNYVISHSMEIGAVQWCEGSFFTYESQLRYKIKTLFYVLEAFIDFQLCQTFPYICMLWYNLYHVFFVVVLEFFISFMISTQQRLYSLFLFLQNLQIALVQHSMLKEQCNAQTAGKLRKVIGYLPMVVGHCQILA